jgi:hypothetical protein
MFSYPGSWFLIFLTYNIAIPSYIEDKNSNYDNKGDE